MYGTSRLDLHVDLHVALPRRSRSRYVHVDSRRKPVSVVSSRSTLHVVLRSRSTRVGVCVCGDRSCTYTCTYRIIVLATVVSPFVRLSSVRISSTCFFLAFVRSFVQQRCACVDHIRGSIHRSIQAAAAISVAPLAARAIDPSVTSDSLPLTQVIAAHVCMA